MYLADGMVRQLTLRGSADGSDNVTGILAAPADSDTSMCEGTEGTGAAAAAPGIASRTATTLRTAERTARVYRP
jgi:hypothetical protein